MRAAALLVYDITDMDSFTRVKNWVKELRKMAGKDIVLVLAGNKVCGLPKIFFGCNILISACTHQPAQLKTDP